MTLKEAKPKYFSKQNTTLIRLKGAIRGVKNQSFQLNQSIVFFIIFFLLGDCLQNVFHVIYLPTYQTFHYCVTLGENCLRLSFDPKHMTIIEQALFFWKKNW